MRPAILAGAMAIPREHVDVATLTRTLTATYRPMGAEESIPVPGFDLDDDYLYAPRQFGLDYCRRRGIPFEDHTSAGFPVLFPQVPAPRDYQGSILALMVEAFDSFYDYVFRAHTGWGKTIGSLIVASRLGVTTVVIVDQDNLKEQWLKALRERFGMTIDNGHVGIVQGDRCDYDGKSVVICMVQTLVSRQFEPEFYDYFGTAILDEVHTCGAPTFSQVLRMFPAAFRFGVSATPTRKDGLQKLLEYNLGRIRVAADKEHNESAVYVLEHPTVYSWYANISPKVGRWITEVSEDGSRNLLIAETALALYETGRDVLVLADRIEQLKHLKSLLYYLGVDDSEMGLYAGYDPLFAYAKEAKPKRRPFGLTKHSADGQVHYSPLSLQSIAKRIPKKRLEEIRSNARILFATYGMCAKGFDEPRLKAGIDATPRSEVEQIHGRILREVPGLKMPIWATIYDCNNPRAAYSFMKRIGGYLKSNGRIYRWLDNGELIECPETELIDEAKARHKELKECEIRTRPDGRNELVAPKAQKSDRVAEFRARVAATKHGVR